jgi:tRNA(adenine34) deaminase
LHKMEDISPSSILNPDKDGYYMLEAVKMATRADEDGDVPIGACIVYEDKIIARAWNQRELLQDPTAHAEMIALTQASEHIGSWRLHGCTMYVTLEPCSMCAGAMVLARIDRLVYGCRDPKTGAVGSLYNIVQDDRLNHRIEVTEGVLEEPCSMMLTDFFRRRREQKRRDNEI